MPEQIKALIHDPDIKIISLDIFDTLIERPTILTNSSFVLLKKTYLVLLMRISQGGAESSQS